MVTDIELASVKLVEKFCRRIEGQYVELAMQPYAPRAFRFIELLRVRHIPRSYLRRSRRTRRFAFGI